MTTQSPTMSLIKTLCDKTREMKIGGSLALPSPAPTSTHALASALLRGSLDFDAVEVVWRRFVHLELRVLGDHERTTLLGNVDAAVSRVGRHGHTDRIGDIGLAGTSRLFTTIFRSI